MLQDKLRATDWEATYEAMEEAVARESYLEWLKENERRSRKVVCSKFWVHLELG
jgi:OTU domain-containing protein 5